MLIHATLLRALHAQPTSLAVRPTEAAPPAATTDALDVVRPYVQPLAWVTVNVRPPMVSVPTRAGPGLGSTE